MNSKKIRDLLKGDKYSEYFCCKLWVPFIYDLIQSKGNGIFKYECIFRTQDMNYVLLHNMNRNVFLVLKSVSVNCLLVIFLFTFVTIS